MNKRYISSIRLENFGAFYNSGYNRILLPYGENLLIYGENGSGKSSIYKALSQFFESSEKSVSFNINQLLAANPGFVEICFVNEEQQPDQSWKQISTDIYRFNSTAPSNNTEPFIRQANRIRGFLSYQQLVKTYTLPTLAADNPNLYELFVEDLLWHHKLPISNRTIENYWTYINSGLEIKDARYSHFNSAVSSLRSFKTDLLQLINQLLPTVNNWLRDYFKYSIAVSLPAVLRPVSFLRGYVIHKELKFEISHFGQAYLGYQNFINEARLSAIAICFYLASIRLNPTGTNYKILFLDDIFIGLDTSNRLPLLEILNKEFNDFQIFITTYDRNWFETAKHWFEFNSSKKFKTLEIYVDSQTHNFDIPLIIENHDCLEVAEQNFLRKDYPAAANALRRECEAILKKNLPDEMRYTADPNSGITYEITHLETLYNSLVKFLEANNIDATFIKEFRFFQKNISLG